MKNKKKNLVDIRLQDRTLFSTELSEDGGQYYHHVLRDSDKR